MAEQYINMDNLAVGYNGKALIHDICIGIEKGEIVTLIGPNGAGKSTLLKIIMQEMPADSGEVIVAKGKTLGYLAQHQDLDTDLTIYLARFRKFL